jgi:nickel-dependent lactate racemase
MKVSLAYGRASLEVVLPERNVVKVLKYEPIPPLDLPEAVLLGSLHVPVNSPPLSELAFGKKSACVVISDITRPVPNRVILPPILETLETAGIPREKIVILVGTGLHRPSTSGEKIEMCGNMIVENYRIEDHHAENQEEHVFLGESPRGVPVWIDRRYMEAELKILTGLIEPHFMAGFSGGRKAICPGIAGKETIAQWHTPRFLEHENAVAGTLKNNPVHEENTWIAQKAGCDFIVNVVLNSDRKILSMTSGDMLSAFERGVETAEKLVTDTVPQPVDVVVTSAAGYPLDLTWYQTVKGIVGALEIVKQGGTVIVASSCAEGTGCREFDQIAEKFPSMDLFLNAIIKEEFYLVNQWQMEELGKVLRKARVVVVTDGLSPELLRRFYVETSPTVEAAVEDAVKRYGPQTTIAVLPEGPYVLAKLEKQ